MRGYIKDDLINLLKNDNPNFDIDKFNKACNKQYKESNLMKNKDAIKLILENYNERKEDLYHFKSLSVNTDWFEGYLCAIKYILINVYGFEDNDKRF